MAIKKKKKNYNDILYELQKEAVRNNTGASNEDLVKVATQEAGNQLRNAYKPSATTATTNRTNYTRTRTVPTTTTKTTTKKKAGLFDAFDDGYDLGDVTKTILTGGKMIWDSATVVGKGFIEDPKQTFKTIGVGIGEGFDKADKMVNNAVDDFFEKISPWRNGKDDNDLSVSVLDLEKFAVTATDEEKAKVLKEYEEKLGKDDPMYKSAEKILAGEHKKSNKYYNSDTYKELETGELSDTQQEIYEQGQSLGGMGYDLLMGWVTGGMAKGLGATAKTAKVASEVAGKTSLFTRTQQSSYEQALAEGYDEKEARLFGVTSGAIEVGLESVGFDELKGLDSIAKGSLVKKAFGEATEEFLAPYGEEIARSVYFGEKADWEETTEEALKGAGAGAVLGVVMGSGGKGYNKVDAVIDKINSGQEVTDAEMAEALKELEAKEPGVIKGALNKATAVMKDELQVQETTEEDIAPTKEEVQQEEVSEEQPIQEEVEEVDEETQSKRRYYQYTPIETDSEITKILKESASRTMNDSTRSHEFVDTVAKFAEKTGTKYRFTNDAELKQLGHLVEKSKLTKQEQQQLTELKQQLTEAKTQQEYDEIQNKIDNIAYYKTNGLVNDDGEVLINIDSQKALNSIVGHETFHLVENEAEAVKLREFAKKYAEIKGDYQERLDRANRLYANTKANIENEVTADIIGDYLFTDQEFINSLSTENPGFFQKIYNEIKHWIKMATAGSKEARQLEQLQHSFEKALNSRQASETTAESDGTKFALDEEGKELTVYHGTSNNSAMKIQKYGIVPSSAIGATGKDGDAGSYNYFTNSQTNAETYKIRKDAYSGRLLRVKKTSDMEIDDRIVGHKKGEYDYRTTRTISPDEIQIQTDDGRWTPISNYDLFSDIPVEERVIDKTQVYDDDYNNVKYSLTDDQGRELSKEQQEYFKDSKVRDKQGNLLTMYHGSNQNFNVFDLEKASDKSAAGKGFYFTSTKSETDMYANKDGKVFETYLDIKKPFVWNKNTKRTQLIIEEAIDTRKSIRDILIEKGYDGVKLSNYSNNGYVYAAFYPNQIKNVDNTNPTSDADIRYSLSDIDSEGDTISEEQKEYFKNTVAKNNLNELERVYHGTPHQFTVFDIEKVQDVALGNGFYFTNSRGSALGYTDGGLYGDSYEQIKEGYINIKHPASRETKTISFEDFKNLYNELKNDPKMFDEEMEMSNIDALLSDYGDVYNEDINEIIKQFYDSYETDVTLIDGLSYISNPKQMYETLRKVTGIDGIVVENPTGYDAYEKYYIAFNSNQFKNVDNTTPTLDDDIRYSLSDANEDIAPTGNYNVYGEDVKLQVENAIAPLKEQVGKLSETITALTEDIAPATQESADNQALENLNTLTSEDAPLNEGAFIMDEETTLEGKGKKNIVNEIRSNFNIKTTEARALYNKIAGAEFGTVDDVYNELQAYKKIKFQEEDDYVKSIQNDIRGNRINVSNIKSQIPDYGNTYRMSLMGKGLILGNSGQDVDTFYQELSEAYPNVFPTDITAEADQLQAIADFLYKDTTLTYTETISDEALYDLAQELYAEIGNNERYRGSMSQKYFWHKDVYDMLAPGEEERVRTNLTQEDYLKSLDNLTDDYAPYLEMAREVNASNTENTSESASILDELNRLDENTAVEEKVAQNAQNKANKPMEKVTKQKGSTLNTLKYLFTNRNEAVDRFSKETGNKNIKFYADHVNNVYGEVSTNINNAQTDNYGKAIGKGITDIFNQARKEGLSEAFDDYLFHKSNVERHKNNKGSKIPLTESQKLVTEYEKTYPKMKTWAKEVNQYNRNNLYKQVEAGLYTPELAKKITDMYDFYVPFFENIEKIYVENNTGEIGVRGTVKRAKGGADRNLLGFEEAMMRQTQSTITAIRKNQLYREIVDSSAEKVSLGVGNGDVSPLYADDKGYYVTAYDGGTQISARVSEDLYKGLDNKLEQHIKDLEQKLGGLTKTLQTLGNIRRNMLTTWSPTFVVTNPLKDIQDAPLNSKYATSWAKNYPKAFKELTTGKGQHVEEFLNMYGQANLMGDYATDSGVFDVTKSAKTGKKLSRILQANEVMELVPRYAEYLASLEHGTSQMEALYNAREVTTNFGRGGVITKALNRNGFTFLNASVQGFDKLIRNFSGENGAKGIVQASLKAVTMGVVPALFNALMYDDDEEYIALPDYIKDNYYLIKTDEGQFVRIPKGRMLSIFGSAGRRTLEFMQGEEDAFEGFLQNAYSQVGVQNPLESNIFAPLFQAYGSENGKTWYGTDIVPSRLQDVPEAEQFDETTDKFSIWLGDKLNASPYKINYVLDQYTGGMGDILLPLITEEGTSDAETLPEMMLAPIKDKFTANSTTDNKYVSDVYSLSDELYKKSNSAYATDEDKLVNQYIYSITSDMGELYAERRAVQNDSSLTKAEKYAKTQAIKDEINRLAKEGLDGYTRVNKTDSYAIVGDREFNKYTANDGTEKWGSVYEDVLEEMNSLGMELEEKSEFFNAQSTIKEIQNSYDGTTDYTAKKRDIISIIKDTNLNDDQKAYLYDKYYASTETLNAITTLGINFDSYLDFESQEFEADKDSNGESISGSKKKKVFDYINSMDIEFEQKLVLAKLQYKSYDEYNHTIIDYLNNSDLTYEEEVELLKKMGFEVDDEGNIEW